MYRKELYVVFQNVDDVTSLMTDTILEDSDHAMLSKILKQNVSRRVSNTGRSHIHERVKELNKLYLEHPRNKPKLYYSAAISLKAIGGFQRYELKLQMIVKKSLMML